MSFASERKDPECPAGRVRPQREEAAVWVRASDPGKTGQQLKQLSPGAERDYYADGRLYGPVFLTGLEVEQWKDAAARETT